MQNFDKLVLQVFNKYPHPFHRNGGVFALQQEIVLSCSLTTYKINNWSKKRVTRKQIAIGTIAPPPFSLVRVRSSITARNRISSHASDPTKDLVSAKRDDVG
jgi:hypothetical protein